MYCIFRTASKFTGLYTITFFIIAGAVANGRAKFEAPNNKASPEKPMRFFGSRSRTNSPMLPVKTPKVPTSANKKDKESNGVEESSETTDKKNKNTNSLTKMGHIGDTEKEKKEDTSKRRGSQLTGKELQKTAKINNRFLSKMKR